MARIIAVLSTRPGAGQTTITVNLVSALVRNGNRVLIAEKDENPKLKAWLGIDQGTHTNSPAQDQIGSVIAITRLGSDFWTMGDAQTIPAAFDSAYDYIFLVPVSLSSCKILLRLSDHVMVCCDLSQVDAAAQVISLDQNISDLPHGARQISLVVLNKVNTKEWHHNADHFSALANYFGYERIADPIPHCERIHDLPLDGHTVWDLSQENLQDAFRRLTEAVLTLPD